MPKAPLWLLVLLLLPVASAQMEFSESYQLRAAFGDIPTTEAREATEYWNMEVRQVVSHDQNGSSRTVTYTASPGYEAVGLACSCLNGSVEPDEFGRYRIAFDEEMASGEHVVTWSQRARASPGDGLVVPVTATTLEDRSDAAVILYIPDGSILQAQGGNVDVDAPLPAVSKQGTSIHVARGSEAEPLPEGLVFVTYPEPQVTTVAPDGGFGLDYASIFIGLVAGALLWAVLVAQGVVQRRSRKQVAQKSSHAVAAAEPLDVLQGRKRALMAALKELEIAKMNNDLDLDVYDKIKAEFKRETVTVMRAIEEAQQ